MNVEIKIIMKLIIDSNESCYIVGGYPRNRLMNISGNDYDLATSASCEKLKVILHDYPIDSYAMKYGHLIVKVNNYKVDITTLREDFNSINRKTDIAYTKSLYIDSQRRDFTINAIYYNLNDVYIDCHNGIRDLDNQLIRTIKDPDISFKEDPIRMLRALRFKSEYNFNIDEATAISIHRNFKLLTKINNNSKKKEYNKIVDGKYFMNVYHEYRDCLLIENIEENKLINDTNDHLDCIKEIVRGIK